MFVFRFLILDKQSEKLCLIFRHVPRCMHYMHVSSALSATRVVRARARELSARSCHNVRAELAQPRTHTHTHTCSCVCSRPLNGKKNHRKLRMPVSFPSISIAATPPFPLPPPRDNRPPTAHRHACVANSAELSKHK